MQSNITFNHFLSVPASMPQDLIAALALRESLNFNLMAANWSSAMRSAMEVAARAAADLSVTTNRLVSLVGASSNGVQLFRLERISGASDWTAAVLTVIPLRVSGMKYATSCSFSATGSEILSAGPDIWSTELGAQPSGSFGPFGFLDGQGVFTQNAPYLNNGVLSTRQAFGQAGNSIFGAASFITPLPTSQAVGTWFSPVPNAVAVATSNRIGFLSSFITLDVTLDDALMTSNPNIMYFMTCGLLVNSNAVPAQGQGRYSFIDYAADQPVPFFPVQITSNGLQALSSAVVNASDVAYGGGIHSTTISTSSSEAATRLISVL